MWVTAIVIGFAGSMHCLGMCSPLAMTVTSIRKPVFVNRLVYNGGRILTYALLGAFVSTFGSMFRLSGFQNVLTVTLGSVLILTGLAGFRQIRVPIFSTIVEKGMIKLKALFSRFLQRKTILSMTFMGMINGLLPCGLTYLALTYCLTLMHATEGFLFMLVFGFGTLPVMLGLTSVLHSVIGRIRLSIPRLTTIVMILLGTLLVTRSIYSHFHENGAEPPSIATCK